MANPNINQFAMSTVQGQMDLQTPGDNVISGQVDAAQSGSLVAGTALKMTTTAGGVPKFVAATASTDVIFGFLARNLKDASVIALAAIEVAYTDAIMYMTAGAAIARDSNVEYDATNIRVNTAAGLNPVVGIALDTATALGDLIRVLIKVPSTAQSQSGVQSVSVLATLAQINAGLVLIPGTAGKKITVVSYVARVTGAFATGTAVILESTNASPVLITTLAEAGLTNGAVLVPGSSNTTLGAGFAVPLGTADGVQVVNSGTAQTGGTSINFEIEYKIS